MIWGILTVGLGLAFGYMGFLLFVVGQCGTDDRKMERAIYHNDEEGY